MVRTYFSDASWAITTESVPTIDTTDAQSGVKTHSGFKDTDPHLFRSLSIPQLSRILGHIWTEDTRLECWEGLTEVSKRRTRAACTKISRLQDLLK